jgi:lysozyme family protein
METSPQFLACLPFTLTEEGGNSNDPHDPGGRTHKGIIQREYDKYRQGKGLPLQSVYAASDDEVQEIYWTSYWLPHCPSLAPGLDLSFFDNCVNEGPLRAIILLQRALGVVADGQFGPATQSAIGRIISIEDAIVQYSAQRANFYKALSTFQYFGKGWLARVDYIKKASLTMAQKGTTNA